MRKLNVLAACAACLLVPVPNASAATVQLESRVFNGSDFTYSYGGTLASTEGIVSGTKLVILDFAGYVADSIFSPYANITGSTELVSSGILTDPTLYRRSHHRQSRLHLYRTRRPGRSAARRHVLHPDRLLGSRRRFHLWRHGPDRLLDP